MKASEMSLSMFATEKDLLKAKCKAYEAELFNYRQAEANVRLEFGIAKQSEGEPVAWMCQINGNERILAVSPPDDAYDEGTLIKLYTHPSNVRRLSDEERKEIFNTVYNEWHKNWIAEEYKNAQRDDLYQDYEKAILDKCGIKEDNK